MAFPHPKRELLRTVLAVAILGCAPGCIEDNPDTGSAIPATACIEHGDCPVGGYCAGGTCAPLTDVDCTQSGCPAGYECAPSGTCQAAPECVTDPDCCVGIAPPCALGCEGGVCVGSECIVGSAEECFVGCHRGQRNCEQGIWSVCDAPPVLTEEFCTDGIDNDCNGATDEGCPECQAGLQEACETPCGVGTRQCLPAGVWEECSASTDCVCEPGQSGTQDCGLCGFQEGICSPDGVMQFAAVCLSEGDCTTGTSETEPCGACGLSTRTCGDDCRWSEWSTCDGGGGCNPGAIEQQGCGDCGSQDRICSDTCEWSEWGACDAAGGCQAGDLQSNDCGKCGQSVSTCNDSCEWGAFGACTGEGVCIPLGTEIEDCELCGTRARSCGLDCLWGPWSSCTGQGPCDPGDTESEACGPDTEVGICAFGSRLRTCDGQCEWNPWDDCIGAVFPKQEICGNGMDESCSGSDLSYPDDHEGSTGNNTCETCTNLGEDPEEVTIIGSFHSVDDKDDYYCLDAIDDPPGLLSLWTYTEHIVVDLLDQPIGVDADLHLYKGLQACQDSGPSVASSVTIGTDDEHLDFKETNEDDTDTYYLRVQNWELPNCSGTYTLVIDGLH